MAEREQSEVASLGQYLLADGQMRGYDPSQTPSIGSYSYFTSMVRYPAFTLGVVREMLNDPRVKFGLSLLVGPILSKGRYSVEADDDKVGEYVQSLLDRFLDNGIKLALKCLVYGYSVNEVRYEVHKGRIQYKEMRYINPLDCRPLVYDRNGELAGAVVKRVGTDGRTILGGPKVLWTTHEPDEHPWYGRSRFYHAYLPWIEKWHDGGFRDCRRLFFYKQAYDGGVFYHPLGNINVSEDPATGVAISKPASEIARQIGDNLRTGGTIYMPESRDAQGNRKWEWQPGTAHPPPQALLDYGRDLDNEIWQGMGIVSEAIESPGDSSGAYGGRSVPMDAFNWILHSIFVDASIPFIKQIVHPLVVLNFGREKSYVQVRPHGILKDNEDVSPELAEQAGMPVDKTSGSGDKPQPSKKPTAMGNEPVLLSFIEAAEQRRKVIVPIGGNLRYGE